MDTGNLLALSDNMMVWFEMFAIAIVSNGLVFIISSVEGAAWSVSMVEINTFEICLSKNDPIMRKVKIAKKLIADRLTTVNFTLLLLDAVLYLGPLMLGLILAGYVVEGGHVLFLGIFAIVRFVVEMVSKMLGYKHRVWVIVHVSCVLIWMLRVFFPITFALRQLNRLTGVHHPLIKEEHVIATAKAAAETQAIAPIEADLIERVIKVGNKTVRDLMIPLSECIRVPMRVKLGQLVAAMGSDKKDLPVLVINEGGEVIGHLSADDAVDVMYKTHDDLLNLSVASEGTVRVDANAFITSIFPALKKSPVGIVESSGRIVGVVILKDVITAMTGANDFE